MAVNDLIIERWLEDNISDQENIPNDECSDVECDVGKDHVLEESSECDSDYENTDNNRNSPPRNSFSADEEYSSEDDIPLSEFRSRPRKKNYFGKNRFRWSAAPPSLRSKTL